MSEVINNLGKGINTPWKTGRTRHSKIKEHKIMKRKMNKHTRSERRRNNGSKKNKEEGEQ